MPRSDAVARFVLLPSDVQSAVASIAREHAAFDPARRRLVIPGDLEFPTAAEIASLTRDVKQPAALVLKPDGSLAVVLDTSRALSAAWIEDAFVRALRDEM
jgi:hypothetical protein